MPRFHLTPDALTDLERIQAYIARDRPDAGRRMVSRLLDAMDTLAEHPGIGAKRDELRPGFRSYPVGNYLIIYLPRDGGVEVLRVLHGAQNLGRIFPPENGAP
jgi:toxin ParE1/3/4